MNLSPVEIGEVRGLLLLFLFVCLEADGAGSATELYDLKDYLRPEYYAALSPATAHQLPKKILPHLYDLGATLSGQGELGDQRDPVLRLLRQLFFKVDCTPLVGEISA